ncbi:MAG: nickel pincer cofactor biosynthesis protein LarC [Pseudanabaenaceae cyanobacterium SKYGB_i_bin29]|nr:nickel pincer cofactor biosynthesis protein LarC [Pseudanabaenaceae cyanobacterium SKYG29]MDW8421590.1 nickel pincer cofactor biosynthesis protein LarC [Pseudanabaenaceae cyanobacterium SKYGB_i_bin29]
MKIAYFDCPTGIAGDMCLGALLHCGVPFDYLQSVLTSLGMAEAIKITPQTVRRQGQAATYVQVDFPHQEYHHHRHLAEIQEIINRSDLPDPVKTNSLQVFQELAAAEGKVHNVPLEQVHFHEVGALDAILDIVGTCAGLHWLGVEKIYSSPLPKGGGTVQCEHGRLPVPTPAVLQMWQTHRVPLVDNGIPRELVTPTGCAILTGLGAQFGEFPPMQIDRLGLGAGTQELPIPNILRLLVGEALPTLARETITVLETQVDDLSPQVIAYTAEELLHHGALDVFTQAVVMKKGRLGTLITVLCYPDRAAVLEAILFRETSTLGIRRRQQERTILEREHSQAETPWGKVGVKIAHRPGRVTRQPEYEDCARLARSHNVPLGDVLRALE